MLYSISSNDRRVKLLMKSQERAVPLSSQGESSSGAVKSRSESLLPAPVAMNHLEHLFGVLELRHTSDYLVQ